MKLIKEKNFRCQQSLRVITLTGMKNVYLSDGCLACVRHIKYTLKNYFCLRKNKKNPYDFKHCMTLIITLNDLPFRSAVKMSQRFMNKFNFIHEMLTHFFISK